MLVIGVGTAAKRACRAGEEEMARNASRVVHREDPSRRRNGERRSLSAPSAAKPCCNPNAMHRTHACDRLSTQICTDAQIPSAAISGWWNTQPEPPERTVTARTGVDCTYIVNTRERTAVGGTIRRMRIGLSVSTATESEPPPR
jgi:hypothetical protein